MVTIVEMMWREEPTTTSAIAPLSPAAARSLRCNPVRMMIAALIETPIDPITPMIALIPKGNCINASDRIDRPADRTQTTRATAVKRKLFQGQYYSCNRKGDDQPDGSHQVPDGAGSCVTVTAQLEPVTLRDDEPRRLNRLKNGLQSFLGQEVRNQKDLYGIGAFAVAPHNRAV